MAAGDAGRCGCSDVVREDIGTFVCWMEHSEWRVCDGGGDGTGGRV